MGTMNKNLKIIANYGLVLTEAEIADLKKTFKKYYLFRNINIIKIVLPKNSKPKNLMLLILQKVYCKFFLAIYKTKYTPTK